VCGCEFSNPVSDAAIGTEGLEEFGGLDARAFMMVWRGIDSIDVDDGYLLWLRRALGPRSDGRGDFGKEGEGSSLGLGSPASTLGFGPVVTASDRVAWLSSFVCEGSIWAEYSRRSESPIPVAVGLRVLREDRFNLDGRSPDLGGVMPSSLIDWRPPLLVVVFAGESMG
jgi:hypothetical protein